MTTFNFNIPHHRNWEREGHIVIENPQTISVYREMRYENQAPEGEYFFAFSEKQFEEGIKRCNDKKVYSAGHGMFGTMEGLDKYFEFCNNKEKIIRESCNPQEVYYWEYNNHECMFDPYEGDAEPMRLIIDIWGKDIAHKIHRYSDVYSIDKLIND